ncbi:precorrin-4 C(11)-methyltransferase [Acidiplasma sp.]|uniref:precorrin-4 C(11)-methyltransferase n=1 Tax=Acidiplasma sp. TaxID=1872114 RepID=UPI002582A4A0|nr:precorrin-4 C(11)-methyltransferase [Acidiplasma sp.]
MIHIIGVGPGDPDLITVKAARIIEKTDVILYADSLVNPDILKNASTDRIYGTSGMNINEINEIIQKFYNEGMDITVIHSGDPSIYGAINDVTSFMLKNNMNYEIIPGISSLFAAAAAMGMELTSPGSTQTIIITRVPRRTEKFESEDLSVMAKHGATLGIFLSASNAGAVTKKLLDAGYSPDDRVIIAYRISWPDQKIIETTVNDLEKTLFENRINRQALILTGGVFTHNSDVKSFLYNPNFVHLFRNNKNKVQ